MAVAYCLGSSLTKCVPQPVVSGPQHLPHTSVHAFVRVFKQSDVHAFVCVFRQSDVWALVCAFQSQVMYQKVLFPSLQYLNTSPPSSHLSSHSALITPILPLCPHHIYPPTLPSSHPHLSSHSARLCINRNSACFFFSSSSSSFFFFMGWVGELGGGYRSSLFIHCAERCHLH